MTANTKMTEERAREIVRSFEMIPVSHVSCVTSCIGIEQYAKAIGFLEGLQAGRAEMAEEIMSKAEFGSVGLDEIEKLIAERDGGEKK